MAARLPGRHQRALRGHRLPLGSDGEVHAGRVIVAAGHAERVVAAFRDIYAARFPIQRMIPVDEYGGSDVASMAATNTSAFNCRRTGR